MGNVNERGDIFVNFQEPPLDDSDERIDFELIRHDHRLAWLPNISTIHLKRIIRSRASAGQLFDITKDVRNLSWSGETFLPSFPLPSSLHTLQLHFNAGDDLDWHRLDRQLRSFLLDKDKGITDLRNLWLSIRIQDHSRSAYPETREDFLDVYFPRTSKICKESGISFVVLL